MGPRQIATQASQRGPDRGTTVQLKVDRISRNDVQDGTRKRRPSVRPPQGRRRTLFVGILFALPFAVAIGASPALATPLDAFTSHVGEDHSSEDHQNAYLEGIILSSADLTSTIFKHADLTNAVLSSATLDGADLMGADLTGADLTNASMSNVDAQNADFTNAILDGVTFATGNVKNAAFVGASLFGADLSGLTDASKADFTGALYDASTILAPGTDTSGMTLMPEPSSAVLLLFGLIGLAVYFRRTADQAARRKRLA
jgi:hypothetical protein